MKAVITGDIVNSRKSNLVDEWMIPLKQCLNKFGQTPKDWEIYRGDSFQIILEDPSIAFETSIFIKSALKKVKHIDARLSIGIGEITYRSKYVTESNGPAFINSGELFSTMEKGKRSLGIKTPWQKFDSDMNIYINLALIAIDEWSPVEAETVNANLQQKDANQKKLGKYLGKTQVAISKALKRAHYTEIMDFTNLFQIKIKELVSK